MSRSFRQGLLPLCFLGLAAALSCVSGCSPVVQQAGSAEILEARGCPGDVQKAEPARRLVRVRFVDYGPGESPPSRVQTKDPGGATTRSYVHQEVATTLLEREPGVADWLVYGFVAAWLGAGLVFLFGGATDPKRPSTPKSVPGRVLRTVVALALPAAVPVSGYLCGSLVYVDNAGTEDVSVTLPGVEDLQVPARSIVPVRVSGFVLDATVRSGGSVLERVLLRPDDGLWESVWRTIWSRGQFVYNICGTNAYDADVSVYTR